MRLLYRHGSMSRKDIADRLLLTQAAITKLTNEMIDQGVLLELGQLQDQNSLGRKKILLGINYDYRYVVGVSIGFEETWIGISNLKGSPLLDRMIQTDKETAPERFLETLCGIIKSMLFDLGVQRNQVLGVGVLMVGTIDRKQGISVNETVFGSNGEGHIVGFGFWNTNIPVKKIMERELQLEVVVENNVRGGAQAELEYGQNFSVSNLLFIRLGYGIGSAIVARREILYGYSNMSGELGHVIVDENGKTCRCGKNGCLETVSSERAILQLVTESFSEENTPELYKLCAGSAEYITLKTVLEASDRKDQGVNAVLEKGARYLGKQLAMYAQLMNPEIIALYGTLFENKIFISVIRTVIKRETQNFNIENLRISSLNNRKAYFGGFAVAVKEMFFGRGAK